MNERASIVMPIARHDILPHVGRPLTRFMPRRFVIAIYVYTYLDPGTQKH